MGRKKVSCQLLHFHVNWNSSQRTCRTRLVVCLRSGKGLCSGAWILSPSGWLGVLFRFLFYKFISFRFRISRPGGCARQMCGGQQNYARTWPTNTASISSLCRTVSLSRCVACSTIIVLVHGFTSNSIAPRKKAHPLLVPVATSTSAWLGYEQKTNSSTHYYYYCHHH